MGKRISIVRRLGHIAYVIYLCLFVLIPVTHCHDAEASENTHCSPQAPLPCFNGEQCCELHHTGGDDHHIHFLSDNPITVVRYNRNDTSPAPQNLAVADETNFAHFQHEGSGIVVSNADFYQEALRPFFSGLSPPLS